MFKNNMLQKRLIWFKERPCSFPHISKQQFIPLKFESYEFIRRESNLGINVNVMDKLVFMSTYENVLRHHVILCSETFQKDARGESPVGLN